MAYPISASVLNLFKNSTRQVIDIDVQGTTEKITESDIVQNGLTIDRYVTSSDKIEIGSAVSSELTMTLNNREGQFDGFVFEGKELFVRVGVKDWDDPTSSVSYIPLGYFRIDNSPRKLSTIHISALDRMVKFDVPCDFTGFTFPMTVGALIQKLCSDRNVTLATTISGLPNYSYSITAAPQGDNMTYRQLLMWAAEITGTCAYIDWNGYLRLEWYGSTSSASITASDRFSSDIYEESITITGVTVKANDSEYTSGQDGYTLVVENNGLIQHDYQTVANALGAVLTGFSYTPYTAKIKPCINLYPLDKITFVDKDGNSVSTVITNAQFTTNGLVNIAAKGETSERNGYASPSPFIKNQASVVAAALTKAEDAIETAQEAASDAEEAFDKAESAEFDIVDVLNGLADSDDKFYTGSLSPSNGISSAEVSSFLPVGLVYIPTVNHSEVAAAGALFTAFDARTTLSRSAISDGFVFDAGSPSSSRSGYAVYDAGNPGTVRYSTAQTIIFTRGRYYTWNGSGWSDTGVVTFSNSAPVGATDGDLWYCGQTHSISGISYHADTVYRLSERTENAGKWIAVTDITSSFGAKSLSNVLKAIVRMDGHVNDADAQIQLIAGWQSTIDTSAIAQIIEKVDAHEASILLLSDFKTSATQAISTLQLTSDEHGSSINAINTWIGDSSSGAIKTLADLRSDVNANGSSITALTAWRGNVTSGMAESNRKYVTGAESPTSGRNAAEAETILPAGMIYIPTASHSETAGRGNLYIQIDAENPAGRSIHSEYSIYNAGVPSATRSVSYNFDAGFPATQRTASAESFSFIRGRYYTWNGSIWSDTGAVAFSATSPSGASDGSLWYCTDSHTESGVTYDADTVYRKSSISENGSVWIAVSDLASSVAARLANLSASSVAQIESRSTETEAQIQLLTAWQGGAESSIASLTIRADAADAQIQLRVEKNGVISAINQSSESITINANRINLAGSVIISRINDDSSTTINGNKLTTGTVVADKILVTGGTSSSPFTIFSADKSTKAVSLAGFTASGSSLYTNGKTSYNSSTRGVYVGTDGIGLGTGNFYVTAAGNLYAQNATITGAVTATSGTFSNCTVDSTCSILGTLKSDRLISNGGDGEWPRGYLDYGHTVSSSRDCATYTLLLSDTTKDYLQAYLRLSVNHRPFLSSSFTLISIDGAGTETGIDADEDRIALYGRDINLECNDPIGIETDFEDNIRLRGARVYLGRDRNGNPPNIYIGNSGSYITLSTGSGSSANPVFVGTWCFEDKLFVRRASSNFNLLMQYDRINFRDNVSEIGRLETYSTYVNVVGTWRTNGSPWISGSDEKIKNTISDFSENYDTLFDGLRPRTYKFNDGTSGRMHSGFIVQETLSALDAANLTTQDFAAVCAFGDPTDETTEWGIRYEEIIALNTWEIQRLKARIAELESKINT